MSDATERPSGDPAEPPAQDRAEAEEQAKTQDRARAESYEAYEADDATARATADADAWARACAEDFAAEQARRGARQGRPQPGSAAEELRKLVEAVAEKVASLQPPFVSPAAQGAVQQLIDQAKAAVEPVIERNPEVFDHLAAAGSELLAAYRSALEGAERRWTERHGPSDSERIDLD